MADARAKVWQLARAVDDLDVPVMCYGLRVDFRGELFPGSAALLALADEMREVRTICHCGRKGDMVNPRRRQRKGPDRGCADRWLAAMTATSASAAVISARPRATGMAIEITAGYAEQDRDHVAALYWEAFSDKLGGVLAPEATGRSFFARIPRPGPRACRPRRDRHHPRRGGPAHRPGRVRRWTSVGYHPVSMACLAGVWRGVLLLLLLRSVGPGQLYVDGLFVTAAARGQGVGALLLSAVADEARRRGIGRVTLDVNRPQHPCACALRTRGAFASWGGAG